MNPLHQVMTEAGKLMLSFDHPKVDIKEGHANFVTEADRAVQSFLIERLSALFPDAVFMAQEDDRHDLGSGLTFVIDPIDGTTNFMRKRGASCISVGLLSNGQPVLGSILNPYSGQIFHAEKGHGAFCDDEPLHVSTIPPERALIDLGSAPYYEGLADKTGRSLTAVLKRFGDVRRSGSAALDLCEIAAGRSEGMFEWMLQPWDFCAGSLLVEEAGGHCSQISGDPLRFDQGIPLMAASDICYSPLQELLNSIP